MPFRGHLMNKDIHLFCMFLGHSETTKSMLSIMEMLDDNFKMASNSTHNVHYVTPFILVPGTYDILFLGIIRT